MDAKLATREQEREVLAWIIRKFPEGRMSADYAQYLIEHPNELPEMLLGMLANCSIATPVQLQAVVSDWQRFFGHLRRQSSKFDEINFPLGDDPGDEAEEYSPHHDETLKKYHFTICQVLKEIKCLHGRDGASLWAQGRYIQAHPQAQMFHPLLGVGASWECGHNWFPFFYHDGFRLVVDIRHSGDDHVFKPGYRFLVRKKKT